MTGELVFLSFALPDLPVAQMLHTAAWVAVLTWASAGLLPNDWRQGRWLLASVFWAGLMAVWDAPLSALGLAFQSPSLLSLCLCVMAAWVDMRTPPRQIFSSPETLSGVTVVWTVSLLLGWALMLDVWGQLPIDMYLWGFTPGPLWVCWGVTGAWMVWVGFQNSATADWHSRAATCVLVTCAVFLLTRAPTGNAWDALMDPWLWVYAHVAWLRRLGFQRTRINHS